MVRKHWDKEKSLSQNFVDLGLCVDPNKGALESRSSVLRRRIKIAENIAAHPEEPVEDVIERCEDPVEGKPKTTLVAGIVICDYSL